MDAAAPSSSALPGQRTRFAHPNRVDKAIAHAMAPFDGTAETGQTDSSPDRTYQITTPSGQPFTVSVSAQSIGADLARSTVDPLARTVAIEVSDRAGRRAVPRVIAQQIAEAAALLDGLADRTDVLRNEETGSDRALAPWDLSAHDLGGIVGLRYLLSQAQSVNPLTRLRIGNDATEMLADLGLLSGKPDLSTGEYEGRSPSFEQRLAVLPPDVQVVVAKLNSLPQVGSLPSAVAERWRYMVKAQLTGLVSGVLPAAALAFYASAANNMQLLTTAAVTAIATVGGSTVRGFFEHRLAQHKEYISNLEDAALPLDVAMRELLDMEKGDLLVEAEGFRQESDAGANRLRAMESRNEAIRQLLEGQQAAEPGGGSVRRDAVGSFADLDAAVASVAEPNAHERVSAADKIPRRRTWVVHAMIGPTAGLGIGYLAHQTLTNWAFSMATGSRFLMYGLAGSALLSAGRAISERYFADAKAQRVDRKEGARESRFQMMTEARRDHANRATVKLQAELVERAAARTRLAAWLDTSEQGLLESALEPDAAPFTADAPPRADRGIMRDTDLGERTKTLHVPEIADSSFKADGRWFSHAEHVALQGVSMLSQLGPRDGFSSARIGAEGVVELVRAETTETVRISVVALDGNELTADSVVARIRLNEDGSYTLELSDRAADPTVARAALAAVDQILAVRAGAPTGADHLVPGSADGPIDPQTLTATDRGRIGDLERLLDGLETTTGRWTGRGLAMEYAAALRAAGLELPKSTENDSDLVGVPRRRIVLDPELLLRVEAQDRLPSGTPSLGTHQVKSLLTVTLPGLTVPLLVATHGHLTNAAWTQIAAGTLGSIVFGAANGIAEWALNRSLGERQHRNDIGETKPTALTLARETAHSQELAERTTAQQAQSDAADEALAARRHELEAAMARDERNRALREAPLRTRILDRLTRRADPAPGVREPCRSVDRTVEASGRTDIQEAPAAAPSGSSADADVAARQAVPDPVAVDSSAVRAAAEAADETGKTAKAAKLAYAGLVVLPRMAAATATAVLVSHFGHLPLSQVFDAHSPLWQDPKENALYLGALTSSIAAMVAGGFSLLSAIGERFVFDRAADLQDRLVATQYVRAQQYYGATRESTLAPLRAQVARDVAVRDRVLAQIALVEEHQAAQVNEAVPVRGRGPLRALADLFSPRSASVAPAETTNAVAGIGSPTSPLQPGEASQPSQASEAELSSTVNEPQPSSESPPSTAVNPNDSEALPPETEEEFFRRMRRHVNTNWWPEEQDEPGNPPILDLGPPPIPLLPPIPPPPVPPQPTPPPAAPEPHHHHPEPSPRPQPSVRTPHHHHPPQHHPQPPGRPPHHHHPEPSPRPPTAARPPAGARPQPSPHPAPPPAMPPPAPPVQPPPVQPPPVQPPPAQPPEVGCPPLHPHVRWLSFTDLWGNRHLIAVVSWSCPDGGDIRLLTWLILPTGSGLPVVVLAELLGTAEPLALRQHVAGVADAVLPQLRAQVPGLDPTKLRWLVRQGGFSTPDQSLAEIFHELALNFDGQQHRLTGVRMLDPPEVTKLVAELDLRPVEEVLGRVGEVLHQLDEGVGPARPRRRLDLAVSGREN